MSKTASDIYKAAQVSSYAVTYAAEEKLKELGIQHRGEDNDIHRYLERLNLAVFDAEFARLHKESKEGRSQECGKS